MEDLTPDSAETCKLLERVRAGDQEAFNRLFARHRAELRQFVELRLDRKLRRRLDSSDVVQETQLEAASRLADFLERSPMPFHLWLRKTAYQRLLMIHRQHFDAARRDLQREVPLPERSSLMLAQQLVAGGPTPSQEVSRRELARRVRSAVGRLSETDREILLMRSFENMSYQEVACLLEIQPDAAKKRHGRALIRLHAILVEMGLKESQT